MIARALPIELYWIIAQYVPKKKDLCSLARCSSALQLAAEPFIYHSLSSHNIIKFVKAAKSVISQPRRHRLVKTLDLVDVAWIRSRRSSTLSAVPRLVTKLLMVTSRLTALRMDGLLQWRWILKDQNHPLLTTLSIVIPAARMESQVEVKNQQYNWDYLERHRSITKLILQVGTFMQRCDNISWNASHHLPLLDTLEYMGPNPLSLLKDRRLQRIRLKFNSVHDIGELILCLSSMGSTLQILDLSQCPPGVWYTQCIQDLVRDLPSLRCIGLPFGLLSFNIRTTNNLVHILQNCPPTLEILKIGYANEVNGSKSSLSKLFSTQDSLKWIIVGSPLICGDAVFTREYPQRPLLDRSELSNALWNLGLPTHHPWGYLRGKLREILMVEKLTGQGMKKRRRCVKT